MTSEEVFSQIGQHMIEGLMVHSQLADYFAFLGFKGFQKCHEYHFFEESWNYKKIASYYMNHYHRILLERRFNNPDIIPEDWYKYSRDAVSIDTKKIGIQAGFERWINWEQKTKQFYQQMYQELMNIGEFAGAIELAKYIVDVDNELADAEMQNLEYSAMDYSLTDITLEQDKMKKEYSKKMKGIFEDG